VDTQVEVRFYSPSYFEGATQDAWGWYIAINFVPGNMEAGATYPIYGMIAIIKQIQLSPSYIGNWTTKRDDDSEEVSVQYDGTILVCAGLNYDEVKFAFETFLRNALHSQPIILRQA
jgi:hypothetical protein